MSKQTDHPGGDSRVADAYRSIADERAPEHLNERVMRMAAKANRTRYAAARAWMRPAAWAVTIGLSLAIVLELTQLPQEPLHYGGAPAEKGPPVEKGPLAEKWRAREMPAKAAPAPAMLDEAFSGDDTVAAPQSAAEAVKAERRSMPLSAAEESIAPEFLCAADVRDSADRWYDCIESLRDTLPASRVATELEQLFAAFPDFVVPEDR